MGDLIFARWSVSIMDDIFEMVKTSFASLFDKALEQSFILIEECIEDLKKWLLQLRSGEIEIKDFEWLIKSRLDTAELTLLKEAGMTLIELDKFKKALLEVIVGSVKKF